MVQFFKVPALFDKLKLSLLINDRQIKTFKDFLICIVNPSKRSAEEAIKDVEQAINSNFAAGIDISIGFWGLWNHVLFIYGYDGDNLYVFDTQKIPVLEYEKITEDSRYVMKLPKEIIALSDSGMNPSLTV